MISRAFLYLNEKKKKCWNYVGYKRNISSPWQEKKESNFAFYFISLSCYVSFSQIVNEVKYFTEHVLIHNEIKKVLCGPIKKLLKEKKIIILDLNYNKESKVLKSNKNPQIYI